MAHFPSIINIRPEEEMGCERASTMSEEKIYNKNNFINISISAIAGRAKWRKHDFGT